MNKRIITVKDLTIMALTVFGEARGQMQEGQLAVACVILNRWGNPGWWSRNKGDGIKDDTIEAVCRDPWQFSCWNKDDPNFAILNNQSVYKRNDFVRIRAMCESLIFDINNGKNYYDPTNGSDHYCTVAVIAKTKWARNKSPEIVIGGHAFYKIGLNG